MGKNCGGCSPGRESTMRDVIFVVVLIVFFVLCAFYVRALDRS